MSINEDRYFARLTVDFDGYKKDTIGLVTVQFENSALVNLPDERGDIHPVWVLKSFLTKL